MESNYKNTGVDFKTRNTPKMVKKRRIYDNEDFFDTNANRVNILICSILRWMFLMFPVMIGLVQMEIIFVEPSSLIIITLFGFVCTFSPTVLQHFKIRPAFLKYYVLFCISTIIFVMSENAQINIYLTYMLALAFSCLYFDPKLTAVMSLIGFLLMIYSLHMKAPIPDKVMNLGGLSGWLRTFASSLSIEYFTMTIVFLAITINSRRHIKMEQSLYQKLKEERERYQIAFAGSSDIIFEYDIKNDFATFFDAESSQLLGKSTPQVIGRFRSCIIECMVEYPEDSEKLLDFLTAKEVEPIEVRFPILNEDFMKGSQFHWILLEGNVIYENNKPVKIIGKIQDISIAKEKQLALFRNSQRDRITKLYTESVCKQMMEEYLKTKAKNEEAVILAIHMEQFAKIGEAYGEMFANTVLREVAELLQESIQKTDLIFRIEGTTFIALLKNTRKDEAEQTIKRIRNVADQVYIGENSEIKINFRVGWVSTTQYPGYEKLFQCAYTAMNAAGKDLNEFVIFYHESMLSITRNEIQYPLQIMEEEFSPLIPEDDMVAYSFAILERTLDLKSAIHILIAQIGRLYHLISVTVLETDWDLLTNTYTYQWSKNDSYFFHDTEMTMSKAEFEHWINGFDVNGVLERNTKYFDRISPKLQDSVYTRVPSELQCAIYEEGIIKGALSFSKEDPSYVWTEEMKKTLRAISRIIATHIVKAKSDSVSKAKSDFVSSISNEIKIPVEMISNMTERLLETDLSEEGKQYAYRMKDSITELLCVMQKRQ